MSSNSTFGKQVRRRNWLVAYTIHNGNGRVIMTSNDAPLTKQLLLEFEHWIQAANPVVAERQSHALIFSVQPLETFWATEEGEPLGIE